MSLLDQPCSRCVAELLMPSSHLRVIWQSGPADIGPEESARLFSVMAGGDLPAKVTLMVRAIAEGWPVEINGMNRAAVPVTTWGADPICERHLWDAWQAHRAPTTVRMAQWGGQGRR